VLIPTTKAGDYYVLVRARQAQAGTAATLRDMGNSQNLLEGAGGAGVGKDGRSGAGSVGPVAACR